MTFKVTKCVSWVFLGADAEMECMRFIWEEGGNGCETRHRKQDWTGGASDCDEDLTKPWPDTSSQ